MNEWKLRIRRYRKASGFNPNSDYIAEATREYLQNDGKIERLRALSDYAGRFHLLADEIDFL